MGRLKVLALAAGLCAAMAPVAAAAANIAKGEAVYGERCSMCHPVDGPGQGPSLQGVVGRKAATAPDFPYTAALKASGLRWTPAALDSFLTNPMKRVPGTAMPMSVPDPGERADLIAYLATLR